LGRPKHFARFHVAFAMPIVTISVDPTWIGGALTIGLNDWGVVLIISAFDAETSEELPMMRREEDLDHET
jgi:hypothetical protein